MSAETKHREQSGTSEVMTALELAEMLRVNPKTVYERLARQEIPGARRLGKTYRISRAAVLRWLAEGQGRVSRSPRRRSK